LVTTWQSYEHKYGVLFFDSRKQYKTKGKMLDLRQSQVMNISFQRFLYFSVLNKAACNMLCCTTNENLVKTDVYPTFSEIFKGILPKHCCSVTL